MDEGINSMVETIHQLEAENEKLKFRLSNVSKSLLAAGKLALSARLVTTSNAKNISQRIEQMEDALNAYDNEIIEYGDVYKNSEFECTCKNFINSDKWYTNGCKIHTKQL